METWKGKLLSKLKLNYEKTRKRFPNSKHGNPNYE